MKILTKKRVVSAVLGSGLLFAAAAQADTTVYTLDADFDQGALDGVNHDAPNGDQLQLNATGTTFPVLWIANAGEDSVTKFDSTLNKETSRYKTFWSSATTPHYTWGGAAPSRTAVDIDGNVYVANRHFDGRPAAVIKILSEGGIDRNGNGTIETSVDTNNNGVIDAAEMLPVIEDGDGVLDIDDFQDERVAWVSRVGANGQLGRSLCIGTDGNIWVGLFSARQYWKLNAADGSVLSGPIASSGVSPYGCLVDNSGRLWSAGLSSTLGELDTSVPSWTGTHNMGGSFYGLALGNDMVYTSGYSLRRYDPATNTVTSTLGPNLGYTLGVAVDGNGDIIAGKNSGGIAKFAPDGSVLWNAPAQPGTGHVRGVIVDKDNNAWAVNLNSHVISKYDGTNGNPLGVFPVGNSPYTYSDAAGFAARNVTVQTGTWAVTTDAGHADADWSSIGWSDLIPAGTSVVTSVRTANAIADLPLASYEVISNGGAPTTSGQFAQVQVRLTANTNGDSPVLYDLTINSVDLSLGCDVDADGDVDRNDISAIFAARNQPAAGPGDVRDNDGDGIITVNDGRQCTLLCTLPRCAVN